MHARMHTHTCTHTRTRTHAHTHTHTHTIYLVIDQFQQPIISQLIFKPTIEN